MRTIGILVTVAGLFAVGLPILAGVSALFGGPRITIALEYAPTFVLGGIVLFVIGTGLRVWGS